MSLASKTGLLASPKKRVIRFGPRVDLEALAPCAMTRQAQFSLRPFGGLYNPYSRGCSILCNHPASLEIKNVVKQAKESWIVEGKAFLHRDEHSKREVQEKINIYNSDLPEHIPEEFFRRYTDTDSRPLTPTPTIASGRTRNSAAGSMLNARRCVTPEPTSNVKTRKQIILDLRRSHSQETLYWNASSDLSPGPAQEKWSQPILKKTTSATRKPTEKIQPIAKTEPPEPLQKENSQTCINAREDDEEEDDQPRRRGKKRKKSKTQSAITATFHASQDPETQIATIGPDSPNLSNRPSLVVNGCETVPAYIPQSKFTAFNLNDDEKKSNCFLDEHSLTILRRGLNLDIVESSFEKNMHRALSEAYRTMPSEKINSESEAVKNLRDHLNLPEIDHGKWIKLPRKFSRSSSRFELPIDSSELSILSPIKYLSQYVSIGKSQKQLYRRVFLLNIPEEADEISSGLIFKPMHKIDEDDDTASESGKNIAKNDSQNIVKRVLASTVLDIAMQEALGFHGTLKKVLEIKNILYLDQKLEINFRTWCGIIAFSERFLNKLDRNIDPANEIEIADFESLERRLNSLNICRNLQQVLKIIKYK